ncbi:S8 family serine peptidase [Catenuloplanes sp. NPDC051500]|uniref:S8 family serine peptidase n=1 Tax=Catenuloplanes sp. NPDC051500 TaxID=3363959 RepID=UPI0037B0FC69
MFRSFPQTGRAHRPVAVLLAAFILAGLAPVPARAVPSGGFVKYTVVAARDGRVEYLWEIAIEVLKDERRYRDLAALNEGRAQADGGVLADPAALHEGWLLLLPWDAYGDRVTYGALPDPGVRPAPAQTPQSAVPEAAPPPAGCGTPARQPGDGIPWAQLRLTPEAAWQRGKGADAFVAVLDSGVDGTVPALAGRVLAGADTTGGSRLPGARGDTDCTGHGTAVAGIVAAASRDASKFVGIAPEATVLPIRVGLTGAAADPASVVAGLEVAVEAGVAVAMIGAAVDVTDPRIADALTAAVAADVVVVLPAPAEGSRTPKRTPDGVLSVGAVGPDERLAERYATDTVDVVAPGVSVRALGRGGDGEVEGSGTGYAVPFVAGAVALLRSSEPQLSAPESAARIQATAESGGGLSASGAPRDPRYGYGMINLAAAVNADPRMPGTLETGGGGSMVLGVLALLALAGLAIGVLRRFR